MSNIIYPYKMGSASAKALAGAIEAKRVYPNGKYRPKLSHFIINWGNSNVPAWYEEGMPILNPPQAVALAANKLEALWAMTNNGVKVPQFTADPVEADHALRNGTTLVGRTLLNSHSGRGIYLLYPNDSVRDRDYRLFTHYIKKTAEYRVHVFDGEVIDVQEKRKRRDIEADAVNYQVRSHENGWVFCREDINPHESVLDEAIKAIAALNLTFGAVDIVYNKYHGSFVLEVNTAPGLEGQTVEIYANAIKKYMEKDHV